MKNLIHFFIFSLLVTSCIETIDLELNEGDNEKLVVDAWLTNEIGNSQVKLSLSTSYFHNETAPLVTDAEVEILGGNQTYNLSHVGEGQYAFPANFKGEVGITYQLKIVHKEKTYTSTATLNRVPPIDKLDFEYDEEYEGYDILLFMQEPAGLGDAYIFKTFKNGTLTADSLQNVAFVDDEMVDGNYIDGVEIDYSSRFMAGDTITVEAWSISLEAYDFFTAVSLETFWRGGIFDTPPANIPTNIEGGALGFFNASAVERNSIILK